MSTHLIQEHITHSIIGAFFEVYNNLGFGFLENLYVAALEKELVSRGHRVAREVGVPVKYRGEIIGFQRLDMLVDEAVVVETKSTYELHRAADRQVISYLKGTGLQVGLLLHFGPKPKFYRVVSTTHEVSAPSARSAESASTIDLSSDTVI